MGNAKLIIGASGGQINMSESSLVAGASGFGTMYVSASDKKLHLVNSDGIDDVVGGAGELKPGTGTDSLYTPSVNSTNPTSVRSIAIGDSANASGSAPGVGDNISIGANALCNNYRSIAIGANTVANETGIAIGYNALNNSGVNGTAIGWYASATADDAIGIGREAAAGATRSVAIGLSSSTTHATAVSIGYLVASVAEATTHVDGLYIKTLGVYADNAAAKTGGLVDGQVYRTSTGQLMVVFT